MAEFDFNIYVEIEEFTVAFSKEDKWIERTIPGNRFTKEIHCLLITLPKGAPVHFPSIKVAMPDNTVRDLRFTVYKK